MDLNSPVKMMLPQAPLVPDGEMYTESSTSDAGLSEEFTSLELAPGHGPLPKGEKIREIVYNANARDDFSDLEIVLARVLCRGSPQYNKGLEKIKVIQRSFVKEAEVFAWEERHCLKLQMEVTLGKTGKVYLAFGRWI